MLYAIITLSVLLIIFVILAFRKDGSYDIFADVNDKELEANAKKLALNMRIPEAVGGSPEISAVLRRLKRAYKCIVNKVKREEELYEFEKWLYENYFSIIGAFNVPAIRNFALLPHKYKKTRIVTISQFIVNTAYGRIDANTLDIVIKTFNTHTPLHNEEIFALQDALNYALIQKISKIAAKSIPFERARKAAIRAKSFSRRYKADISYLYWFVKSGKVIDDPAQVLVSDVNIDNIDYSFSTELIDDGIIIGNCIGSLKFVKDYFSEDVCLNYSYAAELMNRDTVFSNMDIGSKIQYLQAVEKLSAKYNVPEKTLIDAAFALGDELGVHFGKLLFEYRANLRRYIERGKIKHIKAANNKRPQIIFSLMVMSAVTAISVAMGLFATNIATLVAFIVLSLFAFLPLVERLVCKALRLIIPRRPIPMLNDSSVPDDSKVIVTVSHYIPDESALEDAIEKIKVLQAGNKGENISFALLLDFKSSDTQINASDYKLVDTLKKGLQGYSDINAFVRKRVALKGKYGAYERKRGAISDFNAMLMSGNTDKFFFILNTEIERPEFVMVLDSDSALLPKTVLSAINTFRHPINESKDMLVFSNSYNLYSIRTLFSKKYYNESGYERYNGYSSFYYDLTGKAIFCGKGIYRLANFYNKLNGVFPDNKVLSHDILEGAILDTGMLNQTVYEDAPESLVSDTIRAKRWMRGDLMLGMFIRDRIKNRKGEKVKTPKDPIYKYLMLTNNFKSWTTIAQLSLLLIPLFTMSFIHAVPILLCLGGWALVGVLEQMSNVSRGMKISHILRCIIGELVANIYRFIMLPFYAITNLGVILMTYIRMASKKANLLEWKTFAAAQKEKGFLSYVAMILPSFVVMTIIAVIGWGNFAVIGYTAIYFAFAICMYGLGARLQKTDAIDDSFNEELISIARRTYAFFKNEKVDGLICDNYQFKPYKGRSVGTSPTNIGFSLLAEVCAAELGFIETSQAATNTIEILERVKTLKKYKGHLYNWYDINTKKILPPNYISSVDSGNFIAALIVVRRYFEGKNAIATSLCSEIIDNTDFEFLFDTQKGLYRIGYNTQTKEFEGHYDLLASEARLLNYINAASGRGGWNKLERKIVGIEGNILLSWSGTMFEYLMPAIFIQEPYSSLLRHSSKGAVKRQTRKKCNGLWGISESGYYAFDNLMNYQYKAFGISDLALRGAYNRCVISPYSTFLAMPYNIQNAKKNLIKLKDEEVCGEYGYYESVDFSDGKNIVASFMAHHQGMILSSITNVIRDNAISELFMNDYTMAAGKMLLCEKRDNLKRRKKRKEDFVYNRYDNARDFVEHFSPAQKPKYNVLTNGRYSVVLDDFAGGYSICDDTLITKKRLTKSVRTGLEVEAIASDGEVITPYYNGVGKVDDYVCDYDLYKSIYTNLSAGMSMSVCVPHCINGEVRTVSQKNTSEKVCDYNIKGVCDICISDYLSDISHPAFNDLFITTQCLAEKNAVIAKRKSRDNSGMRYAAMVVVGLDECKFETNKYNLKGNDTDKNFGDVLYPCFAFNGSLRLNPEQSREFYIAILYSESLDELESMIDVCNNYRFAEYAMISAGVKSLSITRQFLSTVEDYRCYCESVDCVLNQEIPDKLLRRYECGEYREMMTLLGIYDRTLILYASESSPRAVKLYCGILSILRRIGVDCVLVIKYHESDVYHRPVLRTLKEAVVGLQEPILIDDSTFDERILNYVFLDLSKDKYQYGEQLHDRNYTQSKDVYPKVSVVSENIELYSGAGGFANGKYILREEPLMPYSNVICMRKGGFVATQNGGGYTYFHNSRENKVTLWHNDPIKDIPSERIYIVDGDNFERINRYMPEGYVEYTAGLIRYVNGVFGIECSVEEYVISEGEIKVYEITLHNKSYEDRNVATVFEADVCLNWREDAAYIYAEHYNDGVEFVNVMSGQRAYLRTTAGAEYLSDVESIEGIREIVKCRINIHCRLDADEKVKFFIYLSAKKAENIGNIYTEKEKSLKYFSSLNRFKLKSDNKALDTLFNDFLMCQVVSSRINGRCGFYQAGGAIGFRDQLQDCLALLYSDPERVRAHILDAAAHQYVEGDVMHWWHPPKTGVRTQISDDKLFLPYLVSEYVKNTSDITILGEKVGYLVSDPLEKGVEGRMETPDEGVMPESLLEHCRKAIKNALQFGEHGLLKIGSGDWNDALNAIGMQGRGESVWLSMFAYMVISEFINLLPNQERIEYLGIMDRLYSAIDKTFETGWFKRAYTDDGHWLGAYDSEVCKLDILSQSFSIISGSCDKFKAKSAMDNAMRLVEKDKGIIKLLDPPFDMKRYCGYISAYPLGVRENGGQYTHAAVWFIKAMSMIDKDKAMQLLDMINPINRAAQDNEKYKCEPFVLAADVYADGRAGWTWYTGSASWLYKVILEDILGIRKEGNELIMTPCRLEAIGDYDITYRYKSATYNISVRNSGAQKIIIDGISYGKLGAIPLFDTDKTYTVIIEY